MSIILIKITLQHRGQGWSWSPHCKSLATGLQCIN